MSSKPQIKTFKAGSVIDKRFKIVKKIGAGAFGEIYFAEDITCSNFNNCKCAIKLESVNTRCPQLLTEYGAYRALEGEGGFPRLQAFARFGDDNYLAMSLLHKNLKELFEQCGKKFSLKTVLYISVQALTRLQTLHEKNLIYRDIKPENFMIGSPGTEEAKIIHLIDFGMVKLYVDPETQRHIPFREGKPVTGTARYMSCNALFNYEQSRRDDLEALGYMMLFFLKGSVPWSGIVGGIEMTPLDQCRKIGSMKQSIQPEDLFADYPDEFVQYLSYVRNLQFEEKPDYERLRNAFIELFARLNLVDDGIFDWEC